MSATFSDLVANREEMVLLRSRKLILWMVVGVPFSAFRTSLHFEDSVQNET